VRWNILDTKKRIDGRGLEDGAPDRGGSRRSAAHPRLGAVHPRRDAGDLVVATLGTGDDEQFIDALEGMYKETFLLHYNFPPYLGGRDRPHGLARPPRNRPRQARLARGASDAADQARFPLHAARRLGDHRVERLVLDGDRLRHVAGADGCGRAAEAPSPASPWA
jgi:polyribonucleotide nucleotidyltransferase